ncbi:MAG: hypothetical protein CMJ16_07690 [Peredibacter sp.]|nr:hypothetical protein [Peredibacter sp.]
MSFIFNPNNFNEDLIQKINNGEIEEDRCWDFKVTHYDVSNRDGKKNFMRDITGFANANGGTIVIGVSDDGELEGVQIENFDSLKLQLGNIIRSNSDAPVTNVEFRLLETDAGSFYAICIPKGKYRPHSIKMSGNNSREFVIRQDASNHQMSMHEIKDLFLSQPNEEQINDRINEWLNLRLKVLLENGTIYNTDNDKFLYITLIPEGVVFDGVLQSVSEIQATLRTSYISPPYTPNGWTPTPTADGVISVVKKEDTGRVLSFSNTLKNGVFEFYDPAIIEWYDSHYTRQIHQAIDEHIFEQIDKVKSYIQTAGLNSLFNIKVGLIGLNGYKLYQDSPGITVMNAPGITTDKLILSSSIDVSGDYKKQMKGAFDHLWNACGHRRCYRYDEQGNYLY